MARLLRGRKEFEFLIAVLAAALLLLVAKGSAQITCYTVPSVSGEFNCLNSTDNFQADTIEECCVERNGYFFEGGGDESCQACIVFGFFHGSEITLSEQDEPIILDIGFIKGGNVQSLTGIDRRNTARFGIIVGGNATEGPNADFTIQPTTFEIEGPDARAPFGLTTFVRNDGEAPELADYFILTLEGRNAAGRAIISPAVAGHFVIPTILVVIEDINSTDCGSLPNPANGMVSLITTTFGSTAIYTCISKYTLNGDAMRTCQGDAMWSGSAPICVADCGALPNPANGMVSFTTTTYGSAVNYSCSSNYLLMGEAMRTCQADAVWSGGAPICVFDPVHDEQKRNLSPIIGGAAAGLGVTILVTLGAIIAAIFVRRRKKFAINVSLEPQSKVSNPRSDQLASIKNEAYLTSADAIQLSCNVAYITNVTVITASQNEAYGALQPDDKNMQDHDYRHPTVEYVDRHCTSAIVTVV